MKGKLRMLAMLAVLVGTASTGFGAGFALIEQSVSGLGNAFAGGAAVAEDPSTVFFNPAGMSRLSGVQGLAGLHYIMPAAEFKNEGSKTLLGTALSGGNGGEGGVAALVPNMYLTSSLNDTVTVGLGINAPFGLGTDYDKNWVGRYHAIKSDMMTININPAVSVKLSESVSIGVGVNAQYLKAELTKAIDFGTLDVAKFGGAFGLTPQGADGGIDLKGDSWAYGVNAGILVDVTPNSRVGVAYRQGLHHDVEGTAKFTNAPAAMVAATGGMFKDSDVTAVADLPDTISASVYHRVNPMIAVMADATLTKWSSFQELRFKFANPAQPDGVTTENWEDSWRYSAGLTVNPNDALALRLGLAYDQSPIPSAEYRTPRIPCATRTWASLGAGFAFTDTISMNLGYAHIFVTDPKINRVATPTNEDALNGSLVGTYDASVDIASAELLVKY